MNKIWGIIPSAGSGTRIQPLAFSKELLPVGSYKEGMLERPRAISEYLIERMILAGVSNICMIISPVKSDIIRYYASNVHDCFFTFTVQERPLGLCDAIFRVLPLLDDSDRVIVGLPDTVWFPVNALCSLKNDQLSFLLFPVDQPEHYDAVTTDGSGNVYHIHVKEAGIQEHWIWGAFTMPVTIFKALYSIWQKDNCVDEYFGTLTNKYLGQGGKALGVKAGSLYIDVGTVNGYRNAIALLSNQQVLYPSSQGN